MQAGLAHSRYSYVQDLEVLDIPANQEFTIEINTLDVFSQRLVINKLDPQYTAPNELILIDFHNHYDTECISGSDHSRLKRYCRHFSYSMWQCQAQKMCRWVPENKREFNETEMLMAKGFDHFSC